MRTRFRAYALTPEAVAWLDRFGGLAAMPEQSRQRRMPTQTAPGRPLPKGICSVCSTLVPLRLNGLVGLHGTSQDRGWCDGVGLTPREKPLEAALTNVPQAAGAPTEERAA
jgi:hypothetical protein